MVRVKVGGHPVDFMVDTGAEHSVVTQQIAPFSGREVTIIRATGAQTRRPFCGPRRCWLGGHEVVHEFLYLPDCPVPLIGRDILAKMGAQVSVSADGSAQLKLPEWPSLIMAVAEKKEAEWHVYFSPPKEQTIPSKLETEYPLVWAKKNLLGLVGKTSCPCPDWSEIENPACKTATVPDSSRGSSRSPGPFRQAAPSLQGEGSASAKQRLTPLGGDPPTKTTQCGSLSGGERPSTVLWSPTNPPKNWKSQQLGKIIMLFLSPILVLSLWCSGTVALCSSLAVHP